MNREEKYVDMVEDSQDVHTKGPLKSDIEEVSDHEEPNEKQEISKNTKPNKAH